MATCVILVELMQNVPTWRQRETSVTNNSGNNIDNNNNKHNNNNKSKSYW